MLKEFIGSATQRLSEVVGKLLQVVNFLLNCLRCQRAKTLLQHLLQHQAPPRQALLLSGARFSCNKLYYSTVTPVVSAPATPKPSAASKDFSGYGDADDSFSFDDVD